MAYIGKSIESGTFKVLDTSGNTYNGSNVTFSLGTQVGSAAQLLVSHDGVIQKPGTDYSLASGGASITFSTAPASGASIFIVEISGAVGGTITPADTSVTADKLNTALLTGQTDIGANIADADLFLVDDGAGGTLRKTAASRIKTYVGGFDVSSITGATALDDVPDTTDEFVISDGGTLKRIDANFVMNTPAFYAYKSGNTTFDNNVTTILVPTSIVQNDGTCYDSSNGKFTVPSNQDGTYFVYGSFRINNYDPNRCSAVFFVNGSEVNHTLHEHSPEGGLTSRRPVIHATAMMNLSATDYVEFKGHQGSGSSDTVINAVFGGFRVR